MSDTSTLTSPPTSSNSERALRVAIGSDHGALELKKAVREALARRGHAVSDFGTNSSDSVDYPDYAQAVCRAVTSHEADFGILMCTTGIGMSIAANRFPQGRAALVTDVEALDGLYLRAIVPAVAALAQVAGLDRIETSGHEVLISVTNGAAAISPVAVALAEAGIQVEGLTLRTPTLDDVFLHTTGVRLQEDAA
jgi:hypothetical protein